MAGQYAKPRSADTEVADGRELPSYRGDHVHRIEATPEARETDPARLIEAYFRSCATLNYVRALLDGGFADLHKPQHWQLDFVRSDAHRQKYEALVERINARWASGSYRPIVLLRAHHEPPAVFQAYRAADLVYVSSLHDGMNLVAKEFVAARDDERGVLILSRFTGAARDLPEALIVNPYDIRQAADAMAAALRMPPEEQRDRLRSMRRLVAEFNVYRWAGRMLVDAAELRRRERLLGRLGTPRPPHLLEAT